MIRITTILENNSAATIRVEGQLTASASRELLTACSAFGDATSIKLNLSCVTFADAEGAKAIVDLVARGVEIESCSNFLEQMIADVSSAGAGTVAPDERRFIARLQSGDADAFEEMVHEFGGRMLSVARRILCNDDDAQDAVQDAFASAFQAIDRFNGSAMLSTWLHRIVVNCALMQLRRRRRKPEQSIDELLPRFDADGGWADALPSTNAPAESMLECRDTRELVRRCIAMLPESYRTVLILRDLEDLDSIEAAEHLGISQNVAKVRLHRARQALRKLIEREAAAAGFVLSTNHAREIDLAPAISA